MGENLPLTSVFQTFEISWVTLEINKIFSYYKDMLTFKEWEFIETTEEQHKQRPTNGSETGAQCSIKFITVFSQLHTL